MRNAVTPVVSIILLVLMTVGASILAFFWIIGVQGGIQESVGSSVDSSGVKSCSRLNLLSLRGDEAVIQNAGCNNITSFNILINGVLTDYDLLEPLSPGEVGIINYLAQEIGKDLTVTVILNNNAQSTIFSPSEQNIISSGFTYYCEEAESSCGNVWFSGEITSLDYSTCACCGDDGLSDNFYNGSVSSTRLFCHQGSIVTSWIDFNQTLCEQYGYNWLNNSNLPSTFSFSSDSGLGAPDNWALYGGEWGTYGVLDSYKGFGKVFYIDHSSGTNGQFGILNYTSITPSGSVEFWLNNDGTWTDNQVMIEDGSGGNSGYLQVIWDYNGLRYYDGSYHTIISGHQGTKTWNHYKIVFSPSSWSIYKDGLLLGEDYGYMGNPDGFNRIFFYTFTTTSKMYVDAIDYSWLSGGDNTIGSCCGDDGALDSFNNEINTCTNGVFS